VPANPPACNSTPATINTRDTLQLEANLLRTAIQQYRTALVNCVNCAITSQINQLILEQENIVQVIDQICTSNCTTAPPPLQPQNPTALVNPSHSQYKDNLQAKNWVYGNITATQYKYQVFADSIKYNLTNCPISKPYVNPLTLICFQCPNGMNFSLGARTCEPCPYNFTFSLLTLQCHSPCNSSEYYNLTTQSCQPLPAQATNSLCPLNTPVWNATSLSCQTCPLSAPLYNISSSQCVSCPANTTWEILLSQCILVCSAGNYFDPRVNQCVPIALCAHGLVWNNATKACETACPNSTFFNNITKQCESLLAHNCTSIKPIWNTTTLSC
jgi:hypothetical protein